MSAEFNPSASYVPAGLRKAAKEATTLGWTAKKMGREGWFLYSPKKTRKFYVPVSCKDADTLAKKLRSMMNDAYEHETSAFKPALPPMGAEILSNYAKRAIMAGAVVVPGADPIIRCPVCDDEYSGWEAFAGHQEECEANRKVVLAAKQDAAEAQEPAHSGTISTKEETPVASVSTTPAPKPGPKVTPKPGPEIDPKTGRKRGYRWTQVTGKGNPLHEILYTAVRMNRRVRDETDSQWTLRMAEFIEAEGLLGKLPDADPELRAAYLLNQIREVLYPDGEPVEENPEEIEQYEQAIAAKDAEIATKNEEIEGLNKEVSTLKEFFGTMNSLAQEMNTKEVKHGG